MRRFVLKADDVGAQPELTIDYAAELNPQQAAAATAPAGATLVVAGAGTGKTRTLIYRMAYLVETGTAPEQIVLLTFTRRASREMLGRAAALLDGRCQRVQGGTFHSFCLTILRQYAPKLGLPHGFTILDAADSADVIDVLRTARGLHKTSTRFPKKRTLQTIFSTVTNRGLALEEVLADEYPQFLGHLEAIQELRAAYAAYKHDHALLDYDDLLHRTLDLFDAHPDVQERVAQGCRHVLVDEYQDTNRLQAELVQRFASVHGNVMAVGDDAQSIYRFRGADPRNIFAFPRQFDGAQVVKLEHNYRSTQPVLDLANHLIARAVRKYDKALFTDVQGGERPAVVPAPDSRTESRFVAQMLLQLREEGVPLHQVAVLFRSSYSAYDLEVELGRRSIPYVKYGGLKLSEAAHIKDVVAHLRVIENPQDAVAWTRILQLIEGIGPKTAQALVEWIGAAQDDPFKLQDRPYSPRYIDQLKRLFETLRACRKDGAPLLAQVETVLAYYEPICKQKYYEDYPKRLQDLDHFVALAESVPSRTDFLASLALDPIELTALDSDPLDDDERPLVLSTIHSAKGLEFHTVFLIHALDGVLPSGYALKSDEALDEERRLLYVAVTRAEENLFISYPMVQYRRGQGDYFAKPSRFLESVPEAILEPLTLVEEPSSTSKPPSLPAPPKQLPPPAAPAEPETQETGTEASASESHASESDTEPPASASNTPRKPRRLVPKSSDHDDGLPF